MTVQKFGVGQPIRRKEDARFITGAGTYVDDIVLPGQAHCLILRSPHAHARILSIDLETARQADGVLAIITGADFEKAGYGHLPCSIPYKRRDGADLPMTQQWLLARDKVRYVGDPILAVVAESVGQARAAMEDIFVDYETLEAVTTVEAAQAEGAPQLWDTEPGNESCYWEKGDRQEIESIFASAPHTVSVEVNQNRVIAHTMEPRGAIGSFDAQADNFTLHVSCQGAHNIQRSICHHLMNLDFDKLRAISPDVGGGFGMKGAVFPEYVVVLHAAKLLGRPVKWIADRSESFLADSHSRESTTRGELAFDDGGKILGLKVRSTGNMGAFHTGYGPMQPTLAEGRWVASAYQVPAAYMEIDCYVTNTAPIDAYRGAGRPEAAYVTERLMDVAARHLKMDQAEIRRRNFITAEMMPFKAWNGLEVHSSDFDALLTKTLEVSSWSNFAERKEASKAKGKRRGIGLAYYFETAASGVEAAEAKFTEDGKVQIFVGTQSNGQGHETAFAQVVVDQLGVPFEDVEIVQGDTAALARGNGTGGSRSAQMGSGSILKVGDVVIEKGREIGAKMLQTSADAVQFEVSDEVGRFVVSDTGASVSLRDVISEASRDDANDLDSAAVYKATGGSQPNGCHVCEVEIDEDTGKVDIAAYVVVDDFGTIINPQIVDGQVYGGLAQGIGQALLEDCVYDEQSGQLITGSFTDYAMPRADDLVNSVVDYCGVKCSSNPLGVKGCGEAGTTGALPATINAVVDALEDLGVQSIDMPATPAKIWKILQAAPGH
jgi:carbon-monoxide dehydrogenase large subunit